ncbi:MAG: helix-turn-helix domain-containing protein [Oscillospiraceae bacterium]|nr:helix-turn-helix domain-containing protein [Oscillospiraceae bacterium]
MQFHDKLQKLRKEKGLSQEGLAELLDVSRQAVSKWESGLAYPETDKLIALSEIFGVTVDSLLKGGGGEPPPSMAAEAASREAHWRTRGSIYEYKSKRTFYGLPLVHIHIGFGAKKAKGILAVGNLAQGVLAIGLLSTGLLSFGLLSLGVIGFGVLGIGLLLAIGSISVGTFSIGAVALGIYTIGAVSVGVYSIGAVAAASRVAVGDRAYAPVAVGRVVKGVWEFLDTSAERDFSAVSAEDVKRAIQIEFPGTRDWIVTWMTWFLGP